MGLSTQYGSMLALTIPTHVLQEVDVPHMYILL